MFVEHYGVNCVLAIYPLLDYTYKSNFNSLPYIYNYVFIFFVILLKDGGQWLWIFVVSIFIKAVWRVSISLSLIFKLKWFL